ncbi:hypothetical protein [Clostridium sp.]|nr:hypothetical protein [Clostridium sp.]
MKLKKVIGSFLLLLVGVFVNVNPSSAIGIGIEEMPESMTKSR